MRATRALLQRPCTCGLSKYMPRCDGSHHKPLSPSLSPAFLRESAERLAAANAAGRVLSLVPAPGADGWAEGPDEFSLARAPRTRADAAAFAAALCAARGPRAGYKVGGVDSAPFSGALFARDLALRAPLGFVAVGAELELAATLRAPLGPRADGAEHTPEAVAAAVGAWSGAVELVGARLRAADGAPRAPALLRVADAAGAGLALLAPLARADALGAALRVRDADAALSAVRATLRVNGAHVAAGRGDAARVRGSPLRALAWLANDLIAQGGAGLAAGDVVITGALSPLVPLRAGDAVRAEWALDGDADVAALDFTMPHE
jgi:2-keto-4-pentenoate hydratase